MSVSSRARRVHDRLPWKAYQAIHHAVGTLRPDEDDAYVAAVLERELPRFAFEDVVRWARALGRARAMNEPRTIDLSGPEEGPPEREDERALREYLEGLPMEAVRRLQTLYYAGRDHETDLPALHEELKGNGDDRPAENLFEKVPLDENLGAGLLLLKELGVHANASWHLPQQGTVDPKNPRGHHQQSRVVPLPATTRQRATPSTSVHPRETVPRQQPWHPLVVTSCDEAAALVRRNRSGGGKAGSSRSVVSS